MSRKKFGYLTITQAMQVRFLLKSVATSLLEFRLYVHNLPNLERVEMSKALNAVNVKNTAPTQKAKSTQVVNNAGGFVFTVSDKDRFERFLILGVDGGTYYVKQPDLVNQNVDFVREYIESNAAQAIAQIVDVSDKGRAKSNSPALFALALAMNLDGVDRSLVSNAVSKVARTSTHLFEYAQYLKNLGGWGRAKKNSIANWYESKRPVELAYQAVKYRQRNGWTHRDLFRLSHPKNINQNVGNFILGKSDLVTAEGPAILNGFVHVQNAKTVKQVTNLISEYDLPWEAVPTEFHKDIELWKSLFYSNNLGQTALLRNVVRIAKLGGFNDMVFAADYAERLSDSERIQKGRIHPIQYLNAAVVYEEGQINRGSSYGWGIYRNKTWEVNGKILKALTDGFHKAFKNVEPANKRTLVGLDVSGSMGVFAGQGLDLSCAQVSGAVAMQIVRTEPYSMVKGFSNNFIDLGITENDSLSEVMRKINNLNFGSTDCSLPMEWAIKNDVEIDTFVVITDNETYVGRRHPFQALKAYRQKTGIDARLAVLGVAATNFTIADPSDRGMMDFVGFDSNGPKALADFSAGRI